MSNIIQIKRSLTPGAVPTPAQLQDGELAINLADLTLYLKNDNGDVIDIAGSNFARLLSPAFEGTPTAPTPTDGNNSTQVATTAFVRGEVDKAITGLDFQKDVLAKQEDGTFDPGASPVEGARYLITNSGDLHANFGTISGLDDGDIVEFDGAEFQVIYDVSNAGEGALLWDQDSNSWQRYDGISWDRFGGLSGVTAGDGISVVGDNVSLNHDDTTIHTNATGKAAVKSSGTTGQSMVSQGAGDAAWGAVPLNNDNAVSGVLPAAKGGTGANITGDAAGTMYKLNTAKDGFESAVEGTDFLSNASVVDGGSF
ncbi:MAG: hypothetical protein ACTSXQ_06075 [Alphaproteobacteria bacterium]